MLFFLFGTDIRCTSDLDVMRMKSSSIEVIDNVSMEKW